MEPADQVHDGSHQPEAPPPTMAEHMDTNQPEEVRWTDAATRRVRDLVGRDGEKLEPRPSLLEEYGGGPGGPRRPVAGGTGDPDDSHGPDPADDHLTLSLTAAQILVADYIASQEEKEDRRTKMDNVIARLRETIDLTLPAGTALYFEPASYLQAVGEGLAENDRMSFLIELYFLDPFAPYTIKYRPRVRQKALRLVATLMGDDAKVIRRIKKTGDEALKSHSKQNWAKVGLIGIGAAVVLGDRWVHGRPAARRSIGSRGRSGRRSRHRPRSGTARRRCSGGRGSRHGGRHVAGGRSRSRPRCGGRRGRREALPAGRRPGSR